MDRKKVEGWLAYFGLITYMLFLASLFSGEYAAYVAIGFILVVGTPLALLWATSHLDLRGFKMPTATMPKRSQGKVNTLDIKRIFEEYQKKQDEQKAIEKPVEPEKSESDIKKLLAKTVAHGAS